LILKKTLLVEGKDDQHVIYAIRDIYEIPKDTFTIEELGGVENVLKKTDLTLIDGSSDICLGIVIDADEDINARWQSVSSILEKAGYENLPYSPNSDGTIITQEFLPTFGIWLMPDNKIERGYLETFLTHLVPENSKSWEHAKNSVAALEEKPFIKTNVNHTTKAEIHTFLAWQEEPGKPFGQSITAKYLQTDNPQCANFVNWLKRLFVD
jgi:hypothetical protein